MIAQRSLYAQHIMPDLELDLQTINNNGIEQRLRGESSKSIESTATPLRTARPVLRQQSMQASSRNSPLFRPNLQANSFDTAQIPSSPSLQYTNRQQQPLPTSYHQKLMHLQQLYNSNNVDYIRNNIALKSGDCSTTDQQIYEPGSIATTNHYGYYSMRSNLKSAASEFSFIRPSSSDFQTPQLQQQQQLPSMNQNNLFSLDENFNQINRQQSNRTSLKLINNNNNPTDNNLSALNYDHYNFTENSLSAINGAKRLPSNEGMASELKQLDNKCGSNHLTLADLVPPNRGLPLKPNKKRPQQTNVPEKQKGSSSIGSKIARFFRRTFTRRQKKRPKLAESCSSSLGAFDDGFESIQRARSAFSTSEGMRGERASASRERQLQSGACQQQRMIDLIEAFANKTNVAGDSSSSALDNNQVELKVNQNQQQLLQPSTLRRSSGAQQNELRASPRPGQTEQQLAGCSPLHRSNSVSTSTGFSGFNEMAQQNERQRMINAGLGANQVAVGSRRALLSSPLVARSNKQNASANLTPLFNRKDAYEQNFNGCSPRRSMNLEQLSRPSSIYGQPSMTFSSPISGSNNRGNGEFGLHRNSIHGYHSRDMSSHLNIDFRRQQHHQMLKTPFLDTTCEVAEEACSPTNEPILERHGVQSNRHKVPDNCSAEEATPKRTFNLSNQQQRQAIVNPILHSPTVNLIYDNHIVPTTNSGSNEAFSHYDNHQPAEYNPSLSLLETSGHSNFISSVENGNNNNEDENCGLTISPLVTKRNTKLQNVIQKNDSSALFTPMRQRSGFNQQLNGSNNVRHSLATDKTSRPSAIVAPTTPTNQYPSHESNYARYHQTNSNQRDMSNSPANMQCNPFAPSVNGRQNFIAQPSPLKAAVPRQQYTSYHQSPLVNKQTRVLRRGDGVQATITNSNYNSTSNPQAVINIVGAPGVSLEPSLAQSLLRGTNIDAFESSTSNWASSSNLPNSKTFLVATRLSRTINDTKLHSDSNNGDQMAMLTAKTDDECRDIVQLDRKQSKDEDSSSRSTSSGADQISSASSSSRSKQSVKSHSRSSYDKSMGSYKVVNKNRLKSTYQNCQKSTSRPSQDNRRRGSSTEQSDDLASQAESIEEVSEKKNWINSKLVD